ncbi:uncharacterized protein LOC107832478 isoform X5 [Nicotiana tabacum]|uniref:Uncharacterized protein LOC107832478 isoform X5 n=1 Tax=Nicotiana tabacum TaxID=4097 RepID=A0AC58SG90_TOBAC
MSSSNSSGVVVGGVRVSIPSSVRKTIQNIKEITGNHSEDEIYAMLKECSMDPNETAQKLLFQDTFHEVKRKRDRRRENLNKESAEPKWKPAMQGRGNKGSRGNFTSRHVSLDAGGRRNSAPDKENGGSQVSDKSVKPSSVPTIETKNTISSSSSRANGPGAVAFGSNSVVHDAHASAGRGIKQSEATAGAGSVKSEEPLHSPSHDVIKSPRVSVGTRDTLGQKMPNSSNSSTSLSSPPSSGAYFSASDPVLLPSHDSRLPGAVGTIRREVGGQRVSSDHVPTNSIGSKATTAVSDSRSSTVQVKMSSKFQGPGKNQLPDSSQCASSAQGASSLSRPSSNYNNRPLVGPQKAGPGKEWKPKPTHNNIAQGKATSASSSDLSTVSAEVDTQPQPPSVSVESKEGTSELLQKLEKSHISEIQHVIIPNHLHVPEAEKLGFCFGSFEASLGLGVSPYNAAENEKTPSLSGTSEDIEETENEQFSSDQNPPTTADFSDQSPPSSGQENLSAKPEDVSPSVPEYSESKQETLQGGHQYSAVRTSPNYSFGFVPPTLGSQLAPFENSELQSHDVSRLPNFVVQQPIDPTNYYAQFYRSSADGDGRISPFQSAGVSTKYNGNVSVVPPQTSQPAQESEGSGVWITPGRDLSSLQASSFYNLPQGQVAFTPAQPGHGNLAGLYHPAQPVTAQTVHPLMQQSQTMAGPVDMVGPTATVYQQPQHSQINWPSSY